MLGIFRKKPPAPDPPAEVKLVPFKEAPPATFTALLCDGLTAHHLSSFADLLSLHARLQQQHPGLLVLASLDDLGQAGYTSGHCIEANDLDSVEGHDLSGLDPEVFEDGEHQGHLSTPAEFPIRLANLLERARGVQLREVFGFLYWDGEGNDLITINRDPEAALQIGREKQILFQFVPVDLASKAMAAFPNGYFTSDLNPMQNYLLAQHLEARHGLALFGVGSRFLGFRGEKPLSEDAARALAIDLAKLYAKTPNGAADELSRLLAGRDWLLIRYTDS